MVRGMLVRGKDRTDDGVLEKKNRALVMEDDSGLAQGLKTILSEQGCEVELADTGYGALDLCMRKGFDILVADLRLPDLDGMEIIKLLKEKKPGMKVLVITGYASIGSAVESFQCGASDYLPKPFTEFEFKEALASALEKKKETLPDGSATGHTKRLIQRREVIWILETSPLEFLFWHEFMDDHSGLMKEYRLSGKEDINRGATWSC